MIALDTNAYSKLDAGNPQLERLLQNQDSIVLPVVVIGEIKFGFEKGNRKQLNEERLARFLSTERVQVFYIDDDTAEIYGRISAELKKNGTPIPTNDIWIAAICLQHNYPLATNDKHFKQVPLLQTVAF